MQICQVYLLVYSADLVCRADEIFQNIRSNPLIPAEKNVYGRPPGKKIRNQNPLKCPLKQTLRFSKKIRPLQSALGKFSKKYA